MVNKNKNTIIEKVETVASHTGMLVMLLAIFISMAELAERESHRVVAVLQPSYAFATPQQELQGHGDEQMRRGKEEIRHTSATYGEVVRRQSNSGTV